NKIKRSQVRVRRVQQHGSALSNLGNHIKDDLAVGAYSVHFVMRACLNLDLIVAQEAQPVGVLYRKSVQGDSVCPSLLRIIGFEYVELQPRAARKRLA